MELNNKYYILRHGEALSNVKDVVSCWPEKFHNPLTKKGRETIKKSAQKLRDKKIDLIFSSDLLRTRETAEIVGKLLKIKPRFDKRLREINFGILNNGSVARLWKFFESENQRIRTSMPKGETYPKILDRVLNFLTETDKKYKDKNILIISHEGPLVLLEGKLKGLSLAETIRKYPFGKRIHKGEIRELHPVK